MTEQSKPNPVIEQGPVSVSLRQRGALLMDGFDEAGIDTSKWRIWEQNPDTVEMGVRNGRFVIRARGYIPYNGLWSLNAAKFKDVTLVARIDVTSSGPDGHELLLHLCGGDIPISPDHWVEIAMRHVDEGTVEFGINAAVEKGLFDKSAERLTLNRGDQPGFLARVSLDGSSNLCTTEVRDAEGGWHPVAAPVPLHLRTTHCEIKMQRRPRGSRDEGVESVGWFDDVRIYPRAESNPVLVRLVLPDGKPIYWREGGSWPPKIQLAGQAPRPVDDLVVELWTADGKTQVASVQSRHFAHYMLPLRDAPWDVYPVAALIRASIDGETLGEVPIECNALEGMYPDDVYDVIVR